MKKQEQILSFYFMLLFCILLPLILRGNLYYLHIFTLAIIFGGIATLWNFIMGYAGIFTFASTGLFVVGAYASAMTVNILKISPWVGMLVATIFTMVIGVIVCLPCLKLKGAYVALVTFTFYLILDPLIKLGGPIGTGGSKGLWGISSLTIGPIIFSSEHRLYSYYGAMALTFFILWIVYRLINSTFGLSFIAVRDSENFAENIGVDSYRCKVLVFGISSGLTGTLGAFYVHYIQFISPRTLSLDTFLMIMLMLIVGGYGRFPGAFIGAFVVSIISELLRPIAEYRFFVFGLIMILAIIFMNEGIMGLFFDRLIPLGRNIFKNNFAKDRKTSNHGL